MKRAVLTLLTLALVSGLGLGAAALAANSKRDAAYIASASEEGGGVSLEGLRLGAQAEFRGKADCRLVHTLSYDAASDKSACCFELRHGSENTDFGVYYWTPFITDRLSSSGSGTFEPEDLPAPCRYILDRAAPGGTHSETFPLSDCCEHWPFFADEGFSDIGRGLDELLSGELAQPVPEDTVVEASVTLNANGEVIDYSCNIISGRSVWVGCRDFKNFYILSFTDMNADYEAEHARLYLLDALWSEEYGLYMPDVSSARPLTELRELASSVETPEGGALLLETAEDGYELIQLSPGGELMGRLHTDRAGAENNYARLVAGEDWTLLVQEGRVTAFGYERGRIVYGHEYALPAVSLTSEYEYIYAYDGDRLCALASGRSMGWYSDLSGYSEDWPLLLIAADADGNVLERTLDFPLLQNGYSSFNFELSLA